MRTRFILICIVMLIFPFVSSAQEREMDYHVKLKNGDVIVGGIMHNDDGTVTVITKENDTFIFRHDEVANIEIPHEILEARRQAAIYAQQQEEKRRIEEEKENRLKKREARQINGKGFMTMFEFSAALSKSDVEGDLQYKGKDLTVKAPLVHWINGISCSPHFFIGVGGGVNLNIGNMSDMQFPFYLQMRTTMTKTTVAPFLSLSAGGIINYSDYFAYPYADATLGIRIGKMKKRGTWLGVGMCYTCLNSWKSVFDGVEEISDLGGYLKDNHLSLNVKLAFSF